MQLKAKTPLLSIKPTYRKDSIQKKDFENFIEVFRFLMEQTEKASLSSESEEHHKGLLADFLKDTFYKQSGNYINTKKLKGNSEIDLAVFLGKSATSKVGVLIEVKEHSNKSEMISRDNLHGKAFYEAVQYYLYEKIVNDNHEIKHIIITNTLEWFVFDATEFNNLFYQNAKLKKHFTNWHKGLTDSSSTKQMYDVIGEMVKGSTNEIVGSHIKLNDYKKYLDKDTPEAQKKLTTLFKFFSPRHLLKVETTNDSNSLNEDFYKELLHIIGLAEIREKAKKYIRRVPEKDRNHGSLLENTINIVKYEERLSKVNNVNSFGNTKEEKLFGISLELCITWVNRILFLKLLESQLLSYHNGNKDYLFLDISKIRDFDALNKLFFQVLAELRDKRRPSIKAKFENIPYLNSSLFEITDLESDAIRINSLEDEIKMPYFNRTILKNEKGKRLKGEIYPLEYLFRFLNAYDFGIEGKEEIQEENKSLINASVLGLIFEKINGYKDGSFYTPSFITMYMCRESIRRAVTEKLNNSLEWNCKTFEDIHNHLEPSNYKTVNDVINSITICDPAVGSGHFLVSALNEIISIKAELGILLDKHGKRLKNYSIEIDNDELVITDDDGEFLHYGFTEKGNIKKEEQRLQETLFLEKKTIIENCLFGVDINPNSVKICRLRLWIELLKNAFYTEESQYKELETLPNIDINIKQGNSLISRFALDEDLKEAFKKKYLKKKNKFSLEIYKNAVLEYKRTSSKERKKEINNLIKDIKSSIRTYVSTNDTKRKRLDRLKIAYHNKYVANQLFQRELTKKEFKQKAISEKEIKKIEAQINEIESNRIYQDAFEWRFEFPEVLDNEGNFTGFDCVIGNPPYGLFNKKQNQKVALEIEKLAVSKLKELYPEATGGVINAARIFYALAFKISSKTGFQTMIIPFGILTDTNSSKLRKFIFDNKNLVLAEAFPERDSTKRRVFVDVKMSTAILLTSSENSNESNFELGISYERKIQTEERTKFNSKQLIELSPELVQIPLTNTKSFELLTKIYSTEGVKKLGAISNCLTGEVDITFGKKAITNNLSNQSLYKGVQIDRFISKTDQADISQGDIEYLNINAFKEIYSGKKLNDAKKRRIALQGLTGVNEKYRLKGVIVNEDSYLANSCNYILEPNGYDLETILALFNSSLLNFIFKARSTSSNVNGYEVDNLPFLVGNEAEQLKIITKQILEAKKENPEADTTKLEKEIDQLVYQLYDLTKEEIQIIENSIK